MSDACFHNFDFNRMIYKAISTDDLPSALANLVVKTLFPTFFACLFKSSFTPSEDSAILCELFRQSFANRFLQNRDFFSTHRNSIPYMRGVLMCLLGFWPSGPKPCGSKKHMSNLWLPKPWSLNNLMQLTKQHLKTLPVLKQDFLLLISIAF